MGSHGSHGMSFTESRTVTDKSPRNAGAPVRVVVAIATCGRPRGLRLLLEALDRLILPAGASLSAIVVDNNPDGSAREIVADCAARVRPALIYVHERQRGISYARNAALDAAHAAGPGNQPDFIAFIDDDEVPEPGWIASLLAKQAETGADVVSGPVVPEFDGDAPRWAVDGGFYASDDIPDGAARSVAATNNALIRAGLLGPGGFRFDEALALTGGEDTMLFTEMSDAGHRIVWAREA